MERNYKCHTNLSIALVRTSMPAILKGFTRNIIFLQSLSIVDECQPSMRTAQSVNYCVLVGLGRVGEVVVTTIDNFWTEEKSVAIKGRCFSGRMLQGWKRGV